MYRVCVYISLVTSGELVRFYNSKVVRSINGNLLCRIFWIIFLELLILDILFQICYYVHLLIDDEYQILNRHC